MTHMVTSKSRLCGLYGLCITLGGVHFRGECHRGRSRTGVEERRNRHPAQSRYAAGGRQGRRRHPRGIFRLQLSLLQEACACTAGTAARGSESRTRLQGLADLERGFPLRRALGAGGGWQGKYLTAHDALMGASHLASNGQVDAAAARGRYRYAETQTGISMPMAPRSTRCCGGMIRKCGHSAFAARRACSWGGTSSMASTTSPALEQAVAVARHEH